MIILFLQNPTIEKQTKNNKLIQELMGGLQLSAKWKAWNMLQLRL